MLMKKKKEIRARNKEQMHHSVPRAIKKTQQRKLLASM